MRRRELELDIPNRKGWEPGTTATNIRLVQYDNKMDFMILWFPGNHCKGGGYDWVYVAGHYELFQVEQTLAISNNLMEVKGRTLMEWGRNQ